MRRYINGKSLVFALIIMAYLASRLYRLTQIPIFLDEAIHIMVAKGAMAGDLSAGISLGKWLSLQTYGLFLRPFHDLLWGARFLEVLIGLSIIILLYVEGCSFGDSPAGTRGTVSAIIYLVAPYALFKDRLALTDQFITLSLLGIVLVSYRLVKKYSGIHLFILWLILSVSVLFKTTGVFLFPIPLVVILMASDREHLVSHIKKMAIVYLLYFPPLAYFLTHFAPEGEKSKLALDTSFTSRAGMAYDSIGEMAGIFWKMLTPGLCLFLLGGCAALLVLAREQESRRRASAMLLMIVVLLLPFIFFFQTWYPRYLLAVLVPIAILGGEIGHCIVTYAAGLRGRTAALATASVITGLFLANPAVSSCRMLLNPITYPYPDVLREEYISGSTSGYGLSESLQFINDLARNEPNGINVICLPTWDVPLFGLGVFRNELDPRINVQVAAWNPIETVAILRQFVSSGLPTYLLFNEAYPYPGDKDVLAAITATFKTREMRHFIKPGNQPGLSLLQLELRN